MATVDPHQETSELVRGSLGRQAPEDSVRTGGKIELIRFRVTKDQKRILVGAAKKAGLSLSAWLLYSALEKARVLDNVTKQTRS